MKPATFTIIMFFAIALQAQSVPQGVWIGVEGGTAMPVGHQVMDAGNVLYLHCEYVSFGDGRSIPINVGIELGFQEFRQNRSIPGSFHQIPYGLYVNTNIFKWFSSKLEIKPGIFVGTYAGNFSAEQLRNEMLFGVAAPLRIDYLVSDEFSVSGTFRSARVFGFPYYSTDPDDFVEFTLGINYFIPLR